MGELINKDSLTSLLKRAIDILFVMNPRGTSMGTLFGVMIDGLMKALAPTLENQKILDFKKIYTVYYIIFGIFIFNLPAALRRHSLDPQVESALAAIRKAKRERHISAAHARIMYASLYGKVLEQVVLDKETKDKMRNIERISNETDVSSK